jgi:hypothetical protein
MPYDYLFDKNDIVDNSKYFIEYMNKTARLVISKIIYY